MRAKRTRMKLYKVITAGQRSGNRKVSYINADTEERAGELAITEYQGKRIVCSVWLIGGGLVDL